ncbi:hypothetical protein QBE53_12040 [Vallitaleaceae bacterium 9-2]
MPSISKIRLTNVIYENGAKRYNDMTFHFDGHNGAFLLENGGGKTVFIQTVLQAVIPHIDMADRKIKDTLSLDGNPAHIAIEWILREQPRHYGVTATSLYIENNELKSIKYAYEYDGEDSDSIDEMPFVVETKTGKSRSASRGEINEYYERMKAKSPYAKTFKTISDYGKYIEETFKIIPNEWRKIATINSGEGNVDEFFNRCKTTEQLLDYLLIPTVEEAIQGENSGNFATIFEKQREHFKTNKRLLNEIEQFQQVKEHIDGYVYEYKNLYDARENYEKHQYQMYRMYTYLEQSYQQNMRKQEHVIEEKLELEKQEEHLKHKEASLKVRQKEQIIASLEDTIKGYNEEYSQIRKQYDAIASRKQNIEMSILEKKAKQVKERVTQLERTLEALDENLGVQEVQKKLDINSQKIQGYYDKAIGDIKKTLGIYEHELEREQLSAQQLEKSKEQHAHQRHQNSNRLGKLQGALEAIEQQMTDVSNSLLSDIHAETIVSEYMQWSERLQRNMEQTKDEQHHLQLLVIEQQEYEKQLESIRQTMTQLAETKLKITYELDAFEQAQKALILDIESRSHSLYISDSIYTKEESVIQRLTEKRQHMERQLEVAMHQERKHKKNEDIYNDSEHFFVEPMAKQIINELKEQVGFIEQGTVYIQSISEHYDMSFNALYELFPLWAQTVITTDEEFSIVKEKIEAYRGQLSYPLLLVTKEQMHKRMNQAQIQLEENFGYEVYPDHWKANLTPSHFDHWKKALVHESEKSEKHRKEVSKQLQEMVDLEHQTQRFFKKYTYKEYTELKEALENITSEILAHQQTSSDIGAAIESGTKKEAHYRQTIQTLQTEQNLLSAKIQKANAYIQLAKQKDDLELKFEHVQDEELKLRQTYEQLGGRHSRQLDKIRDLMMEQHELLTQIEVIKNQGLYLDTRHQAPMNTTQDIKTLEEERKEIQRNLLGVYQDRDLINVQIQENQSRLLEIKQQLQLKKEEAVYAIELIGVYAEAQLPEMVQKLKGLSKDMEEWQHKIHHEENEKNRHIALKEDQEEQLIKKYRYIHSFEEELHQVKEGIVSEWKQWKRSIKDINVSIDKLNSQMEEENVLLHELKVHNARISFLVFGEDLTCDPQIEEKIQQLKDVNAQKEMAKQWMKALEQSYNAYMNKKQYVEQERLKFVHYCETHIKEFKLRQAAIHGVNKRESYEELVEYQEQMARVIERNIRIAQEDRRQSDLELQTFLTHLATYIQQVAVELDIIQRKTRITVDNVSKQIFIFDIPQWDSIEAKQQLRHYIEAMVHEYDHEAEQEHMDTLKLREYIEQKLSVKNLLNVVLNDKSIKIKCRKVTNDLKINKAPMAWESSNKWSGGEKWSKNMTLFLGLLNYLAEKKQYLSQSEKSQRTVILDNPFGKASSKHVLDPVFFIAEKLGFQIIALTAHAEGKFISDYFPVVYSGRLRHVSGADKQVMTNEKFINYAYLHEKSPRSIMRMEEKEQLSFLD